MLPLRSGILSGVGERDGSSMDDEAEVEIEVEGAAVLTASVVAVWRRDWFHDV